MEEFINIKQEIRWGDWYFRDHVVPADFDYKAHKKECSEYYRKRGFFASMMFADYYSKMCGIVSDRYMPMDVFFFYVLPCLNRWDLRLAYTDKNLYSLLFVGVNQPETIIKNINGVFYSSTGKVISRDDAIDACVTGEKYIIKPTLDTCNGNGVAVLDGNDRATVADIFSKYGVNFIVQCKISQHVEMGKLNETSLNTLRMFTYRDINGQLHYLSGKTFLRFGGKGSVMDNGSAGGGICAVRDDGLVSDKVVRFKQMDGGTLSGDLGLINFKVPFFSGAVDFVLALHDRLPYFDYIGWDVAIDSNGKPSFIEFNALPSVEGPQMVSGPVFGEYLDEVMDRIKCVKKERRVYSRNVFRPGFDYLLPIG